MVPLHPRAPAQVPRALRVAANLKKELAALIADRSRGQSLLVSVTEVDVSPDLKNAKVFVSVLGNADDLDAVTAALNEDAPDLRQELARRVRLKSMPRLKFLRDTSIADGARLSRLMASGEPSDGEP